MHRLFRVLVSLVLVFTTFGQQVWAATTYYSSTGQVSTPASSQGGQYQQGTMLPQQGNMLPQQGNMLPQQGNMLPQQGNMLPQQGNMLPQQGNMLPQQGNISNRLSQTTTLLPQTPTATVLQPFLQLRSETGDGLIRLSWKLQNLSTLVDTSKMTYTVYYGQEPGKPLMSQQVGNLDNTIVRELKNYQPYYVTVVAADPLQGLNIRSNEIRIIPVPLAELGSKLETVFSKKNVTLLDTAEPAPFDRQLKQFGYDFFVNTAQIAAVDSIPDVGDYQVGPGDTLSLRIWGGLDLQLDLVVDRNGDIMIPKVGAVHLWGLSFDQGKAAIRTALAGYFKDFNMDISLGRPRSIQVYVVGEVQNPGRYAVSSLGTIINALAMAGGPSRNGSLRQIKVNRGNKNTMLVDLYEMLLTGDRSKDLRLQSGDTIFVPVIGPVVAVAGEVKRPAIYELHGATTLKDALKMAGGIAANGYTGRIQVERVVHNQSRVALDYETKGREIDSVLSSVSLQDLDMVKVYPVEEAMRQIVTLKGNVVRPGEYQLHKGMRLKDLIPSSRALLPESFLDSVEITRLSPPDWRKELLTVSLRRALEGNEADNIPLQEQDAVRVFSRWEMEEKPKVAINGAVVTPGTYDYYPGMSVRDLVTAAGSLKRYAFNDEAELSRVIIGKDKAFWKRISFNLGKAMAGDSSQNISLQPDDVLIVRSISDWSSATDRLVAINGEVRYPGIYSVARGEKLSSIIERAGGYTDKAYLRGSKFTRESVRQLQQQRMEEMIARTEQQVARKQSELASLAASKDELAATQAALESLAKSLDKMKMLRAEGRVVVTLAPLDKLKNSSSDIEVEPGDQVLIPERPGTVTIIGQVFNQTSFVYDAADDAVSDYLAKAGGPTSDGETAEMYVVKADGTVSSKRQVSFWRFGGFGSTPLLPGDTLVVPQKLDRIAWMREIKDITQILANIAVAAGTIWIGMK